MTKTPSRFLVFLMFLILAVQVALPAYALQGNPKQYGALLAESLKRKSALTTIPGFSGNTRKSFAQDSEKSLDIERNPNEPLELVDLKIGDRSVKNKIAVKRRKDGEGLDNVKFHETDGWFTRVRVRLRNISGKRIIGLRAYLYLEQPATRILFRIQLTNPKQLQSEPLEPSAEIDLAVSDQSWNQTEGILNQHGADANLAAVTLSMDIVAFSDGLQWNRGHILRRDPNNPNRWIPIGKVEGERSEKGR